MKKIGMNTAMSEIEIEKIVKPISFEPTRAAWKGSIPSSTWRTMFSSMTTASSTTRPTARVMPRRDTLSRLRPSARMRAMVPIREIGSESAGMMVAEGSRRKR